MQSLSHQFLAYCRSKPADGAYDYGDICGCAFALFVRESGICDDATVGSVSWGSPGEERPFPAAVDAALNNPTSTVVRFELPVSARGTTFGALADRLEAALSGGAL